MSEILQLLNDFQGIIGTILGSVTTLIVTDILKKKRTIKKLSCFIRSQVSNISRCRLQYGRQKG